MQACPCLKILGAVACEKAFDPPRCAKPNLAAAMRLSPKPRTPLPLFYRQPGDGIDGQLQLHYRAARRSVHVLSVPDHGLRQG